MAYLNGKLELRAGPAGHPDSVLHDVEAFCSSGIRVYEREHGQFGQDDREELVAYLISEVWRFQQDWERLRTRPGYDRDYRFVPACTQLIGYRIIDWCRRQGGRPGTARHGAVVVSLDATDDHGRRLAEVLAAPDGGDPPDRESATRRPELDRDRHRPRDKRILFAAITGASMEEVAA
jgi:hypothetical protein